jgi:hypothetical protein
MELTLGLTNSFVDLKLGCMEICRGYMCIISRFLKRGPGGGPWCMPTSPTWVHHYKAGNF